MHILQPCLVKTDCVVSGPANPAIHLKESGSPFRDVVEATLPIGTVFLAYMYYQFPRTLCPGFFPSNYHGYITSSAISI